MELDSEAVGVAGVESDRDARRASYQFWAPGPRKTGKSGCRVLMQPLVRLFLERRCFASGPIIGEEKCRTAAGRSSPELTEIHRSLVGK